MTRVRRSVAPSAIPRSSSPPVRACMALVFLLLPGDITSASQGRMYGQPAFEFAPFVARHGGRGGRGSSTQLMVFSTARYDSGVARLRIHIPSGLALVAGDSVKSTRLSLDPHRDPRVVEVRPRWPGRHEVRGELRITTPRHVDEAEFVLGLVFQGDSLMTWDQRPTRRERIENGRRFRYGYECLTPIATPESFTSEDLYAKGERPQVLRAEVAVCASCVDAPRVVRFRVAVDERGRMSDAEWDKDGWAQREVTSAVETARRALERFRFRPARFRGAPVRGCLVVPVEVRSGS